MKGNKFLIITIAAFLGLVLWVYFSYYNQTDTALSGWANSGTPESESNPGAKMTGGSVGVNSGEKEGDWKIYSNDEYGFMLQYPADWTISVGDARGDDYEVIVRIVNPDHPGQDETDLAKEQVLVKVQDIVCQGKEVSIGGRAMKDEGWSKGFGGMYYRRICIARDDWSFLLDFSARDEASRLVMDEISSSLDFLR